MRITDIINGNKPSLSFEVFPPKTTDSFDSVMDSTMEIAALSPSYMSVTYGAGGGTSRYTAEIASAIKERGITALAHLTCVSSREAEIDTVLSSLASCGVENILALRGDIPKDNKQVEGKYRYASELVRKIKEYGGFTVGGACYPEGHPESENLSRDIEALKIKVDAGCEFLTTQMFFDNDILYNFMYRLIRGGVSVPVVAGIMPVTSATQIKRIISISGNALPQRFLRIVDRYGDNPLAMKQAGIAFAIEQVVDLFANGINAVHIYSMNKPDVAAAIKAGVSEIIK
jgi:methylenetetrahydrofolate reductase (NADPH)